MLLAEYQAGNTTTGNEIVVVLDLLRNRDGTREEDYTKCNNWLDGEVEEPVNMKDIIQTTSDFLISHDKKELMELLDEFKEQESYKN